MEQSLRLEVGNLGWSFVLQALMELCSGAHPPHVTPASTRPLSIESLSETVPRGARGYPPVQSELFLHAWSILTPTTPFPARLCKATSPCRNLLCAFEPEILDTGAELCQSKCLRIDQTIRVPRVFKFAPLLLVFDSSSPTAVIAILRCCSVTLASMKHNNLLQYFLFHAADRKSVV